MDKQIQPPDVIILIAAQFDEREVITCHAMLRDQHLAVLLVGVMPGIVQSIRGVTVHPDSYLSEAGTLLSRTRRQLVILAGGETCAAKTLSDPRAHRLIKAVLAGGGLVGVMTRADFLVKETGLFQPMWQRQILRQDGGKRPCLWKSCLTSGETIERDILATWMVEKDREYDGR